MNPISLILKIVGHLGSVSEALKDFEQGAKDLFEGKMNEAEVKTLLSDLENILSLGIISVPGVDMTLVSQTISGGETVAHDVIQAVQDFKSGGVETIVPDLSKAVEDLTAAVTQGIVGLTDHTKEQILAVLTEIKKGL